MAPGAGYPNHTSVVEGQVHAGTALYFVGIILAMNKRSRRPDAVGFRSVIVDVPGPEPVRIEVTPRHYRSLSRQATRERTTVAELLRPTALAVLADRMAH